MSNLEMVHGYLDGVDDDRVEYQEQSNRSEAYKHGWLNGRDDRIGFPRDTAENLRKRAREILNEVE